MMIDDDPRPILQQLRQEIGPQALNELAQQWANTQSADVDADGSVWIDGPGAGYWLSLDARRIFVRWIQAQQ